MRFFIAKNGNLFCLYCKSNLMKGEHYVGIFPQRKNQEGVLEGRILIFHLECFLKWSEENFNKKYQEWSQELAAPKKRGRPRKNPLVIRIKKTRGRPRRYSDPMQARNLRNQLVYHRNLGHDVSWIESQLRKMEIRVE